MFRNRLVDGCQPSEAHGVNHRTLEVRCGNCDARFVAWYRTEEDPGNEVKDVEKCRLWRGDPFKCDNFKDAMLRLIPYVTARNVKRD